MTPEDDSRPRGRCTHCGEDVEQPPGTAPDGSRIWWHTTSWQVHCADWKHQATPARESS